MPAGPLVMVQGSLRDAEETSAFADALGEAARRMVQGSLRDAMVGDNKNKTYSHQVPCSTHSRRQTSDEVNLDVATQIHVEAPSGENVLADSLGGSRAARVCCGLLR